MHIVNYTKSKGVVIKLDVAIDIVTSLEELEMLKKKMDNYFNENPLWNTHNTFPWFILIDADFGTVNERL